MLVNTNRISNEALFGTVSCKKGQKFGLCISETGPTTHTGGRGLRYSKNVQSVRLNRGLPYLTKVHHVCMSRQQSTRERATIKVKWVTSNPVLSRSDLTQSTSSIDSKFETMNEKGVNAKGCFAVVFCNKSNN